MRKDHLHRRSKDAEGTNDGELENGDPLSGSADPFDALINSKSDESSSNRTNGKRAPSPIADSDAENENETKNEDEKSEVNGDSAAESSADNGGNGEEGYEVEDIVDHKFKGKKKYFKIRWKGYDETADSWELEKDLSCPEIIERYVAEHPEANEVKEKKEKKEKKVRISLPPQTPTRAAPKRTAAERKAVVDDPLTDDEDSDTKKSPSKRGRPKKSPTKGSKSSKQEEYEVQKIVGDEIRNGKKYYRIRWKGWTAKDDTWEPKASLSCPEIIKAYESSKDDEKEYEVEKIVGEKLENGARYFLVKWKGWAESDNSWESEKSVDCYELIEKFRDSCRSASKSTPSKNKRTANAAPKASKAKKARKSLSDDESDKEDGEKEWEVEKVVNVRKGKGGKKEFLIRWKGCKASEDTWEPEDGISCPDLIAAFLKKNKK
ncbi:chromo domain-containing protein cec-1-like isoform X3 [Sitodiplosis mosellana]|uniref:chromo domain-containing protein cec-1-like isoform X3 n=1 Tax=Sitodiplosis mosellana TaxID=263140 RepID=UPI002443D93F|nr:chromo domain-containing protein cec-1-like isoform X3 [Sitodiplosis mosellana]